MKHVDMRKLAPAAQEERRRQVIGLRQSGVSYAAIAAQVGLSQTGVFDICQRFDARGEKGLISGKRGRKPDEQKLLTTAQETEIKRLICRHMPDELGLDFALWSREAVRALIRRQCGVRLAVRTTGKYLARWGFTAQKPLRRAYEQQPAAVRDWLHHEYPAIVARARQQRGVIFWGDETGLRADDVRGRSYAPRGKTPVVRPNQRRIGLGLISAVSNRGRVALEGARWRDQGAGADLLPPASDQGCRAQGVPDPRSAASAPLGGGAGLAGPAQGADRGLLPAVLQSGTQPG